MSKSLNPYNEHSRKSDPKTMCQINLSKLTNGSVLQLVQRLRVTQHVVPVEGVPVTQQHAVLVVTCMRMRKYKILFYFT
jgi:hypothetical protein